MIMDQITHSRDRLIFIRNFSRWRAGASYRFGSTGSRSTRSANS